MMPWGLECEGIFSGWGDPTGEDLEIVEVDCTGLELNLTTTICDRLGTLLWLRPTASDVHRPPGKTQGL
jgi:hypothetical protein